MEFLPKTPRASQWEDLHRLHKQTVLAFLSTASLTQLPHLKKEMLIIKDLSATVAQRPLHIFLKIAVSVGNFVKSIPIIL